VISSAKKPPKLESRAEARIAVRRGESANSKSKTAKRSRSAKNIPSANHRMILFSHEAAIFDADGRKASANCRRFLHRGNWPVPSPHLEAAVTCTRRCKFSRRISV